MTPIPIGSTLRRYRKAAGLTQTAAAALAGMPQSQYADIEQDRRPNVTLDTLRRLAVALGCAPEDLIGGRPCDKPSQ